MATNIKLLPQLGIDNGDGTYSPSQFYVATNADWRDQLPFVQPAPSTSPLDLTGIEFEASLYAAGNSTPLLVTSTTNGLLVNGGTNGILSFAVPAVLAPNATLLYYMGALAQAAALATPPTMDILAIADGCIVNLCVKAGPAVVNIRRGLT